MVFTAIDHILVFLSLSVSVIVIFINCIPFILSLFDETETIELSNSLEKGVFFTFFCTTAVLISHWIESGFFPLTNFKESLGFLSCGLSIIYFISKTRNNQNELNKITIASIILTLTFAIWGLFFSAETPESKILVPALQSQWLLMHVTTIMIGYVVLIAGCLLSTALLVFIVEREKYEKGVTQQIMRDVTLKGLTTYQLNQLIDSFKRIYPNYFKTEFLERLDFLSYRAISVGFAFLTLGILCGAVWANEAWGSFWSWDPKETWALITWITFGIYLHVRINQSWKGKYSAFIAFIGFVLIWVCYFGINLLEIGLHSYGSFN